MKCIPESFGHDSANFVAQDGAYIARLPFDGDAKCRRSKVARVGCEFLAQRVDCPCVFAILVELARWTLSSSYAEEGSRKLGIWPAICGPMPNGTSRPTLGGISCFNGSDSPLDHKSGVCSNWAFLEARVAEDQANVKPCNFCAALSSKVRVVEHPLHAPSEPISASSNVPVPFRRATTAS